MHTITVNRDVQQVVEDIAYSTNPYTTYRLSDTCTLDKERRLVEKIITESKTYNRAVVLLGVGTGYGIRRCIEEGIPCLVIDKEGIITALTQEDFIPRMDESLEMLRKVISCLYSDASFSDIEEPNECRYFASGTSTVLSKAQVKKELDPIKRNKQTLSRSYSNANHVHGNYVILSSQMRVYKGEVERNTCSIIAWVRRRSMALQHALLYTRMNKLLSMYDIDVRIVDRSYPYMRGFDMSNEEWVGKVYAFVLQWQLEHKGKDFTAFLHPWHKVLNYTFYTTLLQILNSEDYQYFWKNIQSRPLFKKERPVRILMVSDYHSMTNNILVAAETLGIEVENALIGSESVYNEAVYVKHLHTCMEFKPDFILTLNCNGLSGQYGKAFGYIAETLNIPVASWFVDSPDIMIGYDTVTVDPKYLHIFTWEKTRVGQLEAMGLEATYLPLAGEPSIFYPIKQEKRKEYAKKYKTSVCFVGATSYTMAAPFNRIIFPYALWCAMPVLAREYEQYEESSIKHFLDSKNIPAYEKLTSAEKKYFAANFFYYMHTEKRLRLIQYLEEFSPVVYGDEGWNILLPANTRIDVRPELDYTFELNIVYQLADISLNSTSPQMKHTVNQRVFDVPLSGGFVLTDNQPALEELFDCDTEIARYGSLEECKELLRYYLKHAKERSRITENARRRVLNEHTYVHRLQTMIRTMQQRFGR